MDGRRYKAPGRRLRMRLSELSGPPSPQENVPVTSRRGMTARDSAGLSRHFGRSPWFRCVRHNTRTPNDMASERDLVDVSGTIQRIYATTRGKAGRKLKITLRSANRIHNLTQEDMTAAVPAIRSIKSGDEVDTRVVRDKFGRDLEWLWVLTRKGNTILSYQDTKSFLVATHARTRGLIFVIALVSICSIFWGVAMRRRFWAWRSAT